MGYKKAASPIKNSIPQYTFRTLFRSGVGSACVSHTTFQNLQFQTVAITIHKTMLQCQVNWSPSALPIRMAAREASIEARPKPVEKTTTRLNVLSSSKFRSPSFIVSAYKQVV